MINWIIRRILCIKDADEHIDNKKNRIYNIIRSNIRNFEPLTAIEREFIVHFTTTNQKVELILLYDTCVKVLMTDVLYALKRAGEGADAAEDEINTTR